MDAETKRVMVEGVMIVELVEFEPSAFTIRKNRELLSILSQQEGYTKEMAQADAKLLYLCTRCRDSAYKYEVGSYAFCQDCKDDLGS